MKIAISTQFVENYGAHCWDGKGECPQYWKMKGSGTELVIPISIAKVLELGSKGLEKVVQDALPEITLDNNFSRRYMICWQLLEDAELTPAETESKEMKEGGFGDYPPAQQISKRIE